MRSTTPLIALLLLGSLAITESMSAQLFRLREHSLEHDELTRKFLVYTPRGASSLPGKRPLVLAIHGGAGTHRGMVRGTKRRFNELADRDGFYVVYPNAIDRMWNFGERTILKEIPVGVDDEGFFGKLLDHLLDNYPIDPERVFATGISRGGQASYFIACKFPGRIRAIAPVTMPLPAFLEDDCLESPPVGVAILNGTADPLVPYNGGQITLFGKERGEVLSTDATVELWRQRNGCSRSVETESLPDRASDGIRVERFEWTDCTGPPVVLYRIEGGGHTWPSGGQYLPQRLVGPVTRDIDGATEIWEFFKTFE